MTSRTHKSGNQVTTTYRDASGRTAMTSRSVTSGNTTRKTFRDKTGKKVMFSTKTTSEREGSYCRESEYAKTRYYL